MKRLVIYSIAFCLFMACGKSTVNVKAPTPDPTGTIGMSQFLEGAVFYGLQKDAAPKEMVDKVLNGNLFVGKCPICRPVENGMRKHLQNLTDIKVKRSKESVVAKMMNATTREAQQLALRDLIAEYVGQYYTALQFTPAAQQKMEDKLTVGRKKGMGLKSDRFGKFCPSCDGACKIKMNE